jgi:serine/threonine protein kinase
MRTTAWPWAIVTDNGVPRGFLMRAVPSTYQFNFMTVSQGSMAKLSNVEFLLNSDSYVRAAGISISERDRLNFLGTLAEAMSRLHALGVVIGDLSPKNLLFNLNSYSSCFIIDCDAVALHGESALDQVDTPDWEVPPGEQKGTEASDSYKFGLLAIRLFAKDQSSHDPSAVAARSPELGRLAILSQDHDPLKRPSPGSWAGAIQSASSSPALLATASQAAPGQFNPGYQPYGQPYNPYNVPQQGYGPAGPPIPLAQPPRRLGSGIKAMVYTGLGTIAAVAIAATAAIVSQNHTSTLQPVSVTSPTIIATSNSGGSLDTSQGGLVSDTPTTDTPTPQPPPTTSSPPPSPVPPTGIGIVSISDSISGDPAAEVVAATFDTYFTGINNQDYTQALSVFDPGGVINPNDSSQVQSFANGVSTSTDSAVTLANIDPSDGSIVQSAEVQFTSNQQAGYGPPDNPNATCTNWDITYQLTRDSSGNYLIYKVISDNHSFC